MDHDNPYSAGIYDNGSRAPGEARTEANLERLKAALAAVDKYADCGDNSCLFKSDQRRGMGTNGGCTCVGRGRPFVAAALAELVRAARAATAAEPAALPPAVSERRAPVQPVYKDGRVDRPVGTVSWEEHERAWQAYAELADYPSSAADIAENKGFHYDELTRFLGHPPRTWGPQ